VKWTATQKQIPRQNEKFNLLSANKVSLYSTCKEKGPTSQKFALVN